MFSGAGCFGIPRGKITKPAFLASGWAATPTTAGAVASPAKVFDRLGNYDGTTFKASEAGLYVFVGGVSFTDTNPTTRSLITFQINGVNNVSFMANNVQYTGATIALPLLLKKDDLVTMFVQPVDTAATTFSCYFGGWWVAE